MALRKLSFNRAEKLIAESERHRAELLGGWSPGYVARQLGITRQAVHHAIKKGHLDAVMVNDDEGNLAVFLIPEASFQAYRARREARLANTGPAKRT